jgi:hypothetical protein
MADQGHRLPPGTESVGKEVGKRRWQCVSKQ